MKQVIQVAPQRIAVVFDFDRTLTPEDSFYDLLNHCQVDVDEFLAHQIQPLLDQDWQNFILPALTLWYSTQDSKRKKSLATPSRQLVNRYRCMKVLSK